LFKSFDEMKKIADRLPMALGCIKIEKQAICWRGANCHGKE
jgi:hypothetical protein